MTPVRAACFAVYCSCGTFMRQCCCKAAVKPKREEIDACGACKRRTVDPYSQPWDDAPFILHSRYDK